MKYVYRVREKGSMTLTEKNKLHSMPTAKGFSQNNKKGCQLPKQLAK